MDIELKQVSLVATMEYDKKGKCAELERFERDKVMQILDITTKEPASGVLVQLDACFVIKLANFVNVLADLSPLKMLHAGKGYVMGGERDQGQFFYLYCTVS
jgi:hypothetical protein